LRENCLSGLPGGSIINASNLANCEGFSKDADVFYRSEDPHLEKRLKQTPILIKKPDRKRNLTDEEFGFWPATNPQSCAQYALQIDHPKIREYVLL